MQHSDERRSESSRMSQHNENDGQSPLLYNKKSLFGSNMVSQKHLKVAQNTFSEHSRKMSDRKLKTFTQGEQIG